MIEFFIPLIIDLRIRTEILKTWVNLLELQLLHSIAYFVLCCYLSTRNLRSRFSGKCWNQHNQLYSESKSYAILVERYEECRQGHQVRGSKHLSVHPASQEYTVLISKFKIYSNLF